MRLLRPPLPLLLALALPGCTPSVVVRTYPQPEKHPAVAVAVYPFELPWDLDSPQTLHWGDRLALRIARGQSYAVFGPTELGFTPASQVKFPLPAQWPLAQRLPHAAAEGLVVLHGWGEWHLPGEADANAGQRGGPSAMPGAGQGQGRGRGRGSAPAPDAAGNSNSYVAHLELLDAAGHVLAEAESAPTSSTDLTPEIDALADRILLAMAELAPGTPSPRRPWWSAESVTLSGPRVEEPTDLGKGGGLQAGDVILQVGGAPATDLSIAREQHLAAEGATVPVLVRRAGVEMTLNLPASR